ncbi:MAG: roadblock/LC7 domain-containing protein [Candidatus Helarchaeota archaeon]
MSLTEDQIHTLQKLLSNLESHTELEATAVVTIEGMRIACAVSGDLDADVYSAASAALVNLGETTLKQLNHGSLKEIIVRGDDGYTILTRAGESYMVVGSCKIGSRMGYYLALLHRFCKKVENIVKGEGVSAPAPTPAPTPQISPPVQQHVVSNPSPTPEYSASQPTNILPSTSKDKAAIESALDALSMLEETEPPESISSQPPELASAPSQPPIENFGDSTGLEDALKTLGAVEDQSSAPKVDINTDALVDALRPSTPVKEPEPSSSPPFVPSQSVCSSSSSDDIFNISDKEAVLEALKVLGWEEDENE